MYKKLNKKNQCALRVKKRETSVTLGLFCLIIATVVYILLARPGVSKLECSDYCFGFGCYVCQPACCDDCEDMCEYVCGFICQDSFIKCEQSDCSTDCENEIMCCGDCCALGTFASWPSSDLRDFVTYVIAKDENGNDMNGQLFSLEKTYSFEIGFQEEFGGFLFEYNGNDRLVYRVPEQLDISPFVGWGQHNIYNDFGVAIGWYEFFDDGFEKTIEVWFEGTIIQDSVDLSFIIEFQATIIAEEWENYIELIFAPNAKIDVNIDRSDPGNDDPPILRVGKSVVDRNTEDINSYVFYGIYEDTGLVTYEVVIQACPTGGKAENIILYDHHVMHIFSQFDPHQGIGYGTQPLSAPELLFGNFQWKKENDFGWTQADVTWEGGWGSWNILERPHFILETGESLEPGEYMVFRYTFDTAEFLRINQPYMTDPRNYTLGLENTARGTSNDVEDCNTATALFRKDFVVKKQAVDSVTDAADPEDNYIDWKIVLGGSDIAPYLSTPINGKYAQDSMMDKLKFPGLDEIFITLYGMPSDPDSTWDDARIGGSEWRFKADSFGDLFSIDENTNSFTFVVPNAGQLYEIEINSGGTVYHEHHWFTDITRVVIEYRTNFVETGAGSAPVDNWNRVTFDGLVSEDTETVEMKDPPTVRKSIPQLNTDGIEYAVDFTVPAGHEGSGYFLRDTLSLFGTSLNANGTTTTTRFNVDVAGLNPANFEILINGVPAPDDFKYHFTLKPPEVNVWTTTPTNNAWELYFGENVGNFSTLHNRHNSYWPFDEETTITVKYTVPFNLVLANRPSDQRPIGDILKLYSNSYLRNHAFIFLYDEDWHNPYESRHYHEVGSHLIETSWPIHKIGTVDRNDKNLFHYTVYLNPVSGASIPLFKAGEEAIFKDMFDPRFELVPNSLFVRSASPNQYHGPYNGGQSALTVTNGSIELDLSKLHRSVTTPVPTWNANVINTTFLSTLSFANSPPTDNWYAGRTNMIVRYSLRLRDPSEVHEDIVFENIAETIATAQDNTVYSAKYGIPYKTDLLSKKMGPDGNNGPNIVDIEIIINPYGVKLGLPDQNTLRATDTMSKTLAFFTSSIDFWTKSGDNWVKMPGSDVIGEPWSFNSITPHQVEFFIPDETPVRITYNALVTTPLGTASDLENTIEVEGISFSRTAKKENYTANRTGGGGSYSINSVTLYKRDADVGTNLEGAEFELYCMFLNGNTHPGTQKIVNGKTFYLMNTMTTDASGKLRFTGISTSSSNPILYLLVETRPPNGNYELPVGSDAYTFFSIFGVLTEAQMNEMRSTFGSVGIANNFVITDGVLVYNTLPTGSLTLNKTVTNDTDESAFTFTISSEGLPVNLASPRVKIAKNGSNGQYVATDLANGKFTLTHDTTITISGLLPGEYVITENTTGYSAVYTVDGGMPQEGKAVTVDITADENVAVSFINTHEYGDPLLPETGGRGMRLLVLTGMLILAFSVLFIRRIR